MRAKVLVVVDELHVRRLLQKVAKRAIYEVVTAENGLEAHCCTSSVTMACSISARRRQMTKK